MTDDADGSSSPRYRCLTRIAIAYVVVAIALATVTFAWWRRGIQIRDGLLARWHAEGAPTSAAEINARRDAESSDAARDAGRAFLATATKILEDYPRFATTRPTAEERAARDAWERWWPHYDPRVPAVPADVAQCRGIVQRNAAALATIGPLLDGRPIDWGVRYRRPTMLSTIFPQIEPTHKAVSLLGAAAVAEHAADDDASAVRRLRQIATLLDRLVAPPCTSLVEVLAGSFTRSNELCNCIEALAASLRVTDDGRDRSATRADVRGLIAWLNDGRAWRAAFKSAFESERLALPLDAFENEPAIDAFTRVGARYGYSVPAAGFNVMIRAVDAPIAPPVISLRQPAPPDRRAVARVARRTMLSRDILFPSLPSAAVKGHRGAVQRRAAATLLAIRLFELDRGRVPQALDELVPAYLAVVPLDTIDPAGRPMMYEASESLVAIYLPDWSRATMRPTTMPRDLTDDRRASPTMLVYRGHDAIKRPEANPR